MCHARGLHGSSGRQRYDYLVQAYIQAMLCTCLWRDMKTDGRLRRPRRRRWANAERRVLVASTDGFQPYSRLTGTGMKQLHAWVCNPIAGGGCTVPCQSLEQEMAPKVTKQVRCTVLMKSRCRQCPYLHIHGDPRPSRHQERADKQCSKAADMVVSKAARTKPSRCFVQAAASR